MEKQIRGHCQVCGREQAVTRGLMAKHGYTVDHGYFNGVCAGADHKAIEVERSFGDQAMVDILLDCEKMEDVALKLEQGELEPVHCRAPNGKRVYGRPQYDLIPYADGTEEQKKIARVNAINEKRHRARSGRAHVEYMKPVLDKFHGQQLLEVDRPGSDAKAIKVGDKVKVWGREVVVEKIGYAIAKGVGPAVNGNSIEHVYWTDEKGSFKYPKRYVRKVV